MYCSISRRKMQHFFSKRMRKSDKISAAANASREMWQDHKIWKEKEWGTWSSGVPTWLWRPGSCSWSGCPIKCVLLPIVTCFFANTKVTQKGWIPSEEFSLNFGHTVLVLADTNNIGYKDQVVKATGGNITVNRKEASLVKSTTN